MTRLALLLEINDNLVENCLSESFFNDVECYENWDIWDAQILNNLIEIDKLMIAGLTR